MIMSSFTSMFDSRPPENSNFISCWRVVCLQQNKNYLNRFQLYMFKIKNVLKNIQNIVQIHQGCGFKL